MRWMAAGLALVALGGCGSFPTIDELRRDASAGIVGCRPGEIAISENQKTTWVASCRGMTFQCTASPTTVCAPLAR